MCEFCWNKSILTAFGPRVRKPVFRVSQTKTQTSLHICAVWSVPLLFTYWKVSCLHLLWVEFQLFSLSLQLSRLVWTSLCRKPRRQVLYCQDPKCSPYWFVPTNFTHKIILQCETSDSSQYTYYNHATTSLAIYSNERSQAMLSKA